MLFLLLRRRSPLLGEDETEEMEAPRRRGCLVIANCVLNSPLSCGVQRGGQPRSRKEGNRTEAPGTEQERVEESRVGKQTGALINQKTMMSPRASWPTLFNMLNANVGRTKASLLILPVEGTSATPALRDLSSTLTCCMKVTPAGAGGEAPESFFF